MSNAEWAALIGAYLEGRLGADAFKRRFLEAFEAAAGRRIAVPAKVQALYFVVEAYAGDPMGRGHAVSDDDDLVRAARAALGELATLAPEEVSTAAAGEPPPRVVILESVGADEARRRVAVFSGAGCLVALAYAAVGVLQFFAVAAQLDSVTNWGPAPSTVVGLALAFVPVVGSVIAFFGATDVWGWAWPVAAGVFLTGPLLALVGYGVFRRG